MAGGSLADAERAALSAEVQEGPQVPSADVIEIPTVELFPDDPPEPVEELTPEQQEIARLKVELAALKEKQQAAPAVKESDDPPVEAIDLGANDNILIHFLEDGLTALGKVWYRGEELEVKPGSRAHQDTFNRNGESWLDLRHNDFAQVERFSKVMFRPGPWPGKSYADGTWETLRSEKGEGFVPPPTEEQIAAAEKQRKKRAAPHLPQAV